MLGDEMWKCHVCRRDRPNDKISVAKHKRVNGNGVQMEENVRYCNDETMCRCEAMNNSLAEIEGTRVRLKLEHEIGVLQQMCKQAVAVAVILAIILVAVAIGRFV